MALTKLTRIIGEQNEWDLTEALFRDTLANQEMKPIPIIATHFNKLTDFINKFHFKVTSLPWKLENGSYTLEQITNKDAYGFSVYRIKSKRFYDNSLFMGRLPNSKFAEEVLLAITEDYHLENVENDIQED